jgi:hypothetical protein
VLAECSAIPARLGGSHRRPKIEDYGSDDAMSRATIFFVSSSKAFIGLFDPFDAFVIPLIPHTRHHRESPQGSPQMMKWWIPPHLPGLGENFPRLPILYESGLRLRLPLLVYRITLGTRTAIRSPAGE